MAYLRLTAADVEKLNRDLREDGQECPMTITQANVLSYVVPELFDKNRVPSVAEIQDATDYSYEEVLAAIAELKEMGKWPEVDEVNRPLCPSCKEPLEKHKDELIKPSNQFDAIQI